MAREAEGVLMFKKREQNAHWKHQTNMGGPREMVQQFQVHTILRENLARVWFPANISDCSHPPVTLSLQEI